MNVKLSLRRTILSICFIACVGSIASPLNSSAQDSTQPSVGHQAVEAVLKQVSVDPTALVPKTGKFLSTSGSWSIAKDPPASCPQGSQCVTVFYKVPDDDVICEWVVDLSPNHGDMILDQNEDASHYMIRKLSLDQAEAQVLSRKQPVYPPIAIAAAVKGEVVVRVFVATTGIPTTVRATSGPAMLQGAAIEAARGWTFKPLMAGNRPIGFQTDIIFDFATAGVGRADVKSKP